jgi:hypothetical protein
MMKLQCKVETLKHQTWKKRSTRGIRILMGRRLLKRLQMMRKLSMTVCVLNVRISSIRSVCLYVRDLLAAGRYV